LFTSNVRGIVKHWDALKQIKTEIQLLKAQMEKEVQLNGSTVIYDLCRERKEALEWVLE
jgi:hypothetical protein